LTSNLILKENMTTEENTQTPAESLFLTDTQFASLDLPEMLLKGLQHAGYTHCTPIQAQTLPLSLSGKDIAGQAQTGTGKTIAFLVTIFSHLIKQNISQQPAPGALIIAPTRELALQIYEDATQIGKFSDLKIAKVIGGIDYRKQALQLRQGVDMVISTPGRLIDYIKQKIFIPDQIQCLVIDEADRLFDLGFTKDMRRILKKLPPYHERQSMLFSATLSYRVLELTYEYMNLPEFISTTPDQVAVERIEQTLFHVGKHQKLSLLLGLLQREEAQRVLIFVNTKAGVTWLSQKLRGNKMAAQGITGDLPQRKRLRLMEQFKKGKLHILVATDVASRGIHIEDVTHVINYDLPQDVENYVHRIGRTARAGKTGRAFALACEEYVYHLEPLENMLGYQIPVQWPDEEWFIKDQAKPVGRRTKHGRKGVKHRRKRPMRAAKKRGHQADEPRGIFSDIANASKTQQASTPSKHRRRVKKKRASKSTRPKAKTQTVNQSNST
jgi:ATP-dependent RNA helicase RhlB